MKKRLLLFSVIFMSLLSVSAQFSSMVAGKFINIVSKPTFEHYMTGLDSKESLVCAFYVEVVGDSIFNYETIISDGKLSGVNIIPVLLSGVDKKTVKVLPHNYDGYSPSKCYKISFSLLEEATATRRYYRSDNEILTDNEANTTLYFATKSAAKGFVNKYLK